MMANNIGFLMVKRFDEYVGIVTETELARKVLGKGLNRETIGIEEHEIFIDTHLKNFTHQGNF